MAAPEFRAVLRIYRIPDGDHYGAALPAAARGAWKHNGTATRYNADKTLGFYFSESQLELIDEITEPDTLTYEETATDICTFSATITYPHNSDIAEWLLANIRPSLAERPRNFIVLKIISADDDDTSDDIADPLLGDVIASQPIAASNSVIVPSVPAGGLNMPSWTKRGMSGTALDIDWGPTERGIQIHLRGGSWLWWAQATSHIRDASDIGFEPATWGQALSALMTANSSYTIPEFAEAVFGSPDAAGTAEYSIEIEDAVLASEEIVSPVGLNSLLLVDETSGLGDPAVLTAGAHNLLETIQRTTESRQLWLDGSTNIFRLREFGGTEENPKLVWDADDFFGRPRLSDRIPQATSFLASQSDYRRNWRIYAFAQRLAQVYGHVQKSLVSMAPKPQSFADEITWTAEAARAAILRTADKATLNHIKAQTLAMALSEADNVFGFGMLRWGDGTRFGIDFGVGDIVEVRLGGSDALSSVRGSRRGLVVRKVAFALDGNRRWGVRVGFGALADVAPAFNPDRVEMPKAYRPKDLPEPTTDGTGPVSPISTPAPPVPPVPPAPFDEGSETPPGAGEPPEPPAPYDEGSEYVWQEPDIPPKPAPYDPGSEYVSQEPDTRPYDPGSEYVSSEPPQSRADINAKNRWTARAKAAAAREARKRKLLQRHTKGAAGSPVGDYDPGSEFLG